MGFLKLSGSVAHEFLAFLCRWRERANGVGSSLPVSELVRHTLEVVKHGAADRFRPDLFCRKRPACLSSSQRSSVSRSPERHRCPLRLPMPRINRLIGPRISC